MKALSLKGSDGFSNFDKQADGWEPSPGFLELGVRKGNSRVVDTLL